MENVYKTPESDLNKPENNERVFAGFWIRVLASIIDSILIVVATMPLLIAVYGVEYWTSSSFINGVWDFVISYVLPAVAVIVFWVYKSATPGKMICGLKVISLSGPEQIGVGRAIGRYIAYFPAIFVFCLGLIWVAFDRRKQGWHDKLANTAVVRKP